jgi:uncharacterized protein (DUF433 family)
MERTHDDVMSLDRIALPDCLERCADGSIRVRGHRVSLYLILDALFSGKTISEIESLYPTIPAPELHQVLLFCDMHTGIMYLYYKEQRSAAAAVLARPNPGPTLEELRRRKARKIHED